MKTVLVALAVLLGTWACGTSDPAPPPTPKTEVKKQPEKVDPCSRSRECRISAHCESPPEGSRCRARSCAASDEGCITQSDRECRASSGCINSGKCTSWNRLNAKQKNNPSAKKDFACVKGGVCCVITDEDCQKSANCKKFARCSAREVHIGQLRGTCVVTSDADCARSDWCKNLGHCSFVARAPGQKGPYQQCVASPPKTKEEKPATNNPAPSK